MSIKQEAWEKINEKLQNQYGGGDAIKRRHERRAYLLREVLKTPEMREFFWEFVANAKVLGLKAYTGNADCYYILGLKHTPEELIREAKRTDFKLYQQMEYEAMKREEEAKNER